MTSMPQPASAVNPPPASTSRVVIGGVDTHQELHVAAVIDTAETVLATRSFSTTRAGYRALIRWVRSFGDVRRVGVEAAGSCWLPRGTTSSGCAPRPGSRCSAVSPRFPPPPG